METTSYSRGELLAELASLAERLGEQSISRRTWVRETGITASQVYRHFDSWNEFVTAAGLVPDDRSRVPDNELLEALRDALVQAGGITTKHRVRRFCRYGGDVYTKHFGTGPQVLGRLRECGPRRMTPTSLYLADLPQDGPGTDSSRIAEDSVQAAPSWTSNAKSQYGPFLNFRGLQHAPINEQGVVFMFGMVAFDLGFVVEGVGTGFPDCEAKRTVGKHVWERVRFEFEFRSRNFRDHGHDPTGCDLIVCWEHDWPECPIEVVELRASIDGLGD